MKAHHSADKPVTMSLQCNVLHAIQDAPLDAVGQVGSLHQARRNFRSPGVVVRPPNDPDADGGCPGWNAGIEAKEIILQIAMWRRLPLS